MEWIFSWLKLCWTFAVVIVMMVFAAHNGDFVSVNLAPLGYQLDIRIFSLVLMVFAMGFLTAIGVHQIKRLGRLLQLKKLYQHRKIEMLEKKLKNLTQ
jgi:uncharacterized membrane protein YciS (DUF1049 family)